MTTDLTPLLDTREQLLAFVRSRISDPQLAEDVLQSSLLKALRAAPSLEDESKLVPWFYRILRNAITDSYRSNAARAREVDIELAGDVEQETETYAAVCRCIEALIPDLKPEYRDVILALDVREEPAADVASRLDVTPGNLKVRRHRARQALRASLERTCRVCAEHHCLDCTCEAAPRV